jgi:hypothetical protein
MLRSAGTSLLLRVFPLQRVHLRPTRKKPSGTQARRLSSMAAVLVDVDNENILIYTELLHNADLYHISQFGSEFLLAQAWS